MAARYLPVELQDADGNIVHPHTDADIVWMQDGKTAEQAISEKTQVIISSAGIPVAQRKEGAIYMFIEGAGSVTGDTGVAMASPAVGYKIVN